MPSPKFAMTGCIATLLIGLMFMAANLYFSGGRHSSLANMFFALAVFSEMAFVVFSFLWVYSKAWAYDPAGPGQMPPGAPGQKLPPGANQLPPGVIGNKLPLGAIAPQKPGPPAA